MNPFNMMTRARRERLITVQQLFRRREHGGQAFMDLLGQRIRHFTECPKACVLSTAFGPIGSTG